MPALAFLSMSVRDRRLLCGLLLALSTAGAVAAQSERSSLPGVFGEILDVRVVNLEVVVTDRDGVPIRGLESADFRLFVDGEEMPIDYFSEVHGGTVLRPQATPAAAAPPPLAEPGPLGTSYLVYIDDFFSIAVDRNRVLDRIEADLSVLGPEDRMAVVAYDGRELEMLTSWSGSVPELSRVLKRARERKSWGLHRLVESQQARLDLVSGGNDNRQSFEPLNPASQHSASRLEEQLDRSVSAVVATLRSFARPPGRKVMILLSGGWPFFPAEFLYGPQTAELGAPELMDEDDLYQRLADTANLVGYTLYPADVPGMSRVLGGGVAAEFASVGDAGPTGFQKSQELRYTLNFLAEETGGQAFFNPKKEGALSGAAADTRSYYWLGFSPVRAWDDHRHEVEIRTVDEGHRVRARAGFLDFSRDREVTMAVESELLFGASTAAPSDALEISLGKPERLGLRRMGVPISVTIPLDRVTFLPGEEGFVNRAELRVALMDDLGYRARVPTTPISLGRAEMPEPGAAGEFLTTLKLPRRRYRGVVSIYDPLSGRMMSQRIEIDPRS